MSEASVLSERVGDVGVLTLNRPDKMNAIDRSMIDDFEAAVHQARKDGVRALLVTGSRARLLRRGRPDRQAGRGAHSWNRDAGRHGGCLLVSRRFSSRNFPGPR